MKYIRIVIDGVMMLLGGLIWIFMEYLSSYNPGSNAIIWEDTVSFLFPYVKGIAAMIMALGLILLLLDLFGITKKSSLKSKE